MRWTAYTVITALCLFRLATFTPQPLDSPGAFHLILWRFFTWFLGWFGDRAFSIWSAICLVALLLPPALAALNYRTPRSRVAQALCSRGLCSRWFFWASIAICLVLCRFPTLLEGEFNPDEGQFLTSACKLFYDPNFFHAVDCGTSGPINIYPLMLPAILGFSPDFATSRAIALAIILLSAFLLYRSVWLIAAEELARIAVLPLIGAFAVFQDRELIHYSSECVPILLISTGLYLCVRVLREPARYAMPILLMGLLVCAAFFAKMQSVPIVAAQTAVAMACVYMTGNAGKLWRPALLFVAGAIPLALINAALCVSAGVWRDFWVSYIQANSSYASVETPFLQNLQGFIQFVMASNEVLFFLFLVTAMGVGFVAARRNMFAQLALVATSVAAAILLAPLDRLTIYAFLALAALCAVPVYLALAPGRESPGADPLRWFGILAFATLAAAIFSVYVAHHAFNHYLLLLFLPLCTCVAWMLARQNAVPFIALLITLVVGYQSYLWSFQDDHVFKNVATTLRSPEGEYIRSLTSPRGRIFVWGWTVRPYLESGHVPAARDTNVANCFRAYNLMTLPPIITPTPASTQISRYYENRILCDLRANPPELFIDAIGPTSWFLTDRRYYDFEQFPEIAYFVETNYVLVAHRYDQRYYLRRDRAAAKPSPR